MVNQKLPRLVVSENGRFIVTESGEPFFWLGDTAWELFHRLRIEEVKIYLSNRSELQFTLFQAVALAEFDGINSANEYGDEPFIDRDPMRPYEPYWKFVDEVISLAADYHLYVGLLPTWGDKVADMWGTGPVIFNEDNAYAYGNWIGKRYRDQSNVVWIMGGDRPVTYVGAKSQAETTDLPVWRAMAGGIRDGVAHPLVMTYHPCGGRSSSEFIHQEDWLDMNMMQSGHGSGHDVPVWEMINRDYELTPPKPTLDGEPNYEDHPVNPWPAWDPATGYFDDYDVRKQLYRSVFAGGCGVTYGHHSVWQMYSPRYEKVNHALMYWSEAIHRPGASQVKYLRMLIESRPYLDRIPDLGMIVSKSDNLSDYVCATRDEDSTYAFIYLPSSKPVTINLDCFSTNKVMAWWYRPINGIVSAIGEFSGGSVCTLSPPEGVNDCVLILENANTSYRSPDLIFS
jgi:hypothetical protein